MRGKMGSKSLPKGLTSIKCIDKIIKSLGKGHIKDQGYNAAPSWFKLHRCVIMISNTNALAFGFPQCAYPLL